MSAAIACGTIIDERYRIERLLGSGAHGAVYLAEDIQLQRNIALKLLDFPPEEAEELIARLQREARALNRVGHPNIVQVFRIGRHGPHQMYLAMEYVDGESLRQMVDRSPLPFTKTVAVASQIAEALHHAELQGITHRDVKPHNVLVGRDDEGVAQVKLVDFGLCTLSEDQSHSAGRITRTGIALGTPVYMSPEQCFGQPTDVRSDIYSFGCTLFEMLTGFPPFSADAPAELLMKHVSETPPKLLDVAKKSSCPAQLQDIYLRCLAKRPDDRFQSFSEVIAALKEIKQAGDACLDESDTLKLRKHRARRRLTVAGVVLVLVGFCLLSSLIFVVNSLTGEQKGKALAMVANMVPDGERQALLLSGLDVVYRLNGADRARAAADETLVRGALNDMTDARKAALDAAYMRFFMERNSDEHAAAYAEPLIMYYISRMSYARREKQQLDPEELAHIESLTKFFLTHSAPKDMWQRLNSAFEIWDVNESYAAFLSGQSSDLQMLLQELNAESAVRSGSLGSGHHYRRCVSHYLRAMDIARELGRKADFNRYAEKATGLRNPEGTGEWEIMVRTEVAEYAVDEERLRIAAEEIARCDQIAQEDRKVRQFRDDNVMRNVDKVRAKLASKRNTAPWFR